MYYIIDSLISFLLRVTAGKNPLGEHHKYGYLFPIIRRGRRDDEVVLPAFLIQIAIVMLAIISLFLPKIAPLLVPMGALLAIGLYYYYRQMKPR